LKKILFFIINAILNILVSLCYNYIPEYFSLKIGIILLITITQISYYLSSFLTDFFSLNETYNEEKKAHVTTKETLTIQYNTINELSEQIKILKDNNVALNGYINAFSKTITSISDLEKPENLEKINFLKTIDLEISKQKYNSIQTSNSTLYNKASIKLIDQLIKNN